MTTEAKTTSAAPAATDLVEITVRDQLRRTEYVYHVRRDATVMDLKETICRGDPDHGVPAGPPPQQMTLYQLLDVKDAAKQETYIPKHTDKLGTSFCKDTSANGHFMVYILVHKYFA